MPLSEEQFKTASKELRDFMYGWIPNLPTIPSSAFPTQPKWMEDYARSIGWRPPLFSPPGALSKYPPYSLGVLSPLRSPLNEDLNRSE